MLRTLFAAFIGLVVGVGLGSLAAFYLAPQAAPASGWTSYPMLASASMRGSVQTQGPAVEPHWFYFQGILLGGGFGAILGAMVGVAGVVQMSAKAKRSSSANPV
jgi:hypothetical protein